MNLSIAQQVHQRANASCEYCQLPEAAAETPFQLDHIIALQHGGPNELDNLAWACFYCNKYKGPNLAGIDPETGQITRLFHPRKDVWHAHFKWAGAELIGLTAEGRTTVLVLGINRPLILARRSAIIAEGIFPATPSK
jgi:hypothetical protein